MKIPRIGLKKVRITFRSGIHSVGKGVGCRAGGRGFHSRVVLVRESGFPESGKFLLMESRIRGNFACEIQNPGLWSSEYSLRNPESH